MSIRQLRDEIIAMAEKDEMPDDICNEIKTRNGKIIGKGGYGNILAYDDCKIVAKEERRESDGEKYIRSGSVTVFNNDSLAEYFFSHVFGQNKHSAMFYKIPAYFNCSEKGYMLIPRFAGDMSLLSKLKSADRAYNIDFCVACVLHSTLILQREYAAVHRDLKYPNVLLKPIGEAQWTDASGKLVPISSMKYVTLDFGDDIRMSFDVKRLKYIPKIADWGFTSIFQLDDESYIVSDQHHHIRAKGSMRYGLPNVYNEWYDMYFFMAYLCIFFKQGNDDHIFSSFCKKDSFVAKIASFIFTDAETNDLQVLMGHIYTCMHDYQFDLSPYRLKWTRDITSKTSTNIIKWYASKHLKKSPYKYNPKGLTIAVVNDAPPPSPDYIFTKKSDINTRRFKDTFVREAKVIALTSPSQDIFNNAYVLSMTFNIPVSIVLKLLQNIDAITPEQTIDLSAKLLTFPHVFYDRNRDELVIHRLVDASVNYTNLVLLEMQIKFNALRFNEDTTNSSSSSGVNTPPEPVDMRKYKTIYYIQHVSDLPPDECSYGDFHYLEKFIVLKDVDRYLDSNELDKEDYRILRCTNLF